MFSRVWLQNDSAGEQVADGRLSRIVEAFAREKDIFSVRLLSGTDQVLSQQARLRDIATSCGLGGELDQLPYILREGAERGKRPYLLLFPDSEGTVGAAALFHAYEIAGISTRCFMPIDFGGSMNMIAPQEKRKQVAIRAAQHLFRRGALMVLASIAGEDFSREAAELGKKKACAVQTRPLRENFLLKDTVDETLATMGAHTRRNLRYYARRAASELGASFTVNGPVSAAEFLEMNRQSAFAVSESLALWRYKNWREFKGSFLASLRARNGRLLSLIGGRGAGTIADIDWQMNLSEMTQYSFSTVMRAHVIEYLIGRGIKVMRFEGGTPHSMTFAFQEEAVGDLFLSRRPLGRWFADRVIAGLLPHDNRFANVFRYELLEWHGKS